MFNCDNNCEAVADLHESSVNLIQYSKQINKWVNGGQAETVNIGGVDTPTLRNLAMAIKQLVGVWPDDVTIRIDPTTKKIYVPLKPAGGVHVGYDGLYIDSSDFLQLGGGLAKDAQGMIYVDFDQMPTTKFDTILETFRKGLRLPKYLNGDTNFYVDKNHANAGNTLIEGRGLSTDLPFASINSCAAYICNNYNVGPYTATIVVADALYEERITLGDFSRTTGKIAIKPAEASGWVRLKTLFDLFYARPITCRGGVWELWYPKIADSFNYTGAEYLTTAPYLMYSAFHVQGGALTLYAPDVTVSLSGALSLENTVYFCANESGNLTLQVDETRPAKMIFNNGVTGSGAKYHHLLFARGADATMNFGYSRTAPDAAKKLLIAGDFTTVANFENKASFSLGTSTNWGLIPAVNSGGSVTGKRYACTTGATCNVLKRGAEFFPGNAEGTVETASYCWYL